MAKLTMPVIEALYSYGKAVFKKEIGLNDATDAVLKKYPDDIAESSASFYIGLYSEFMSGKGSTWNQNSSLVLYYIEHIYLEEGQVAGQNAYNAGLKFAKAKSKQKLEKDLLVLWQQLENKPEETNKFETWLRNNPHTKYTDHTIYKYIHALDKAEEWLSIDLPKPITAINSMDEFREVSAIIKTVSNFEEINQSHGHGDLSAALRQYQLYLEDENSLSSNTEWWPSLDEYNPGITKGQWLDLLLKLDGPAWDCVLAMFYTEPQGITCSALENKFNMQPMSISGRCTQLAKRVYKETNCPLANNGEKDQYWPILFQGRDADSSEPGTYVWKLRSELYEALTVFDILRFLPTKNHLTGQFDSWEIIDENTAIKHCDKSFFEHNGSGVPKGICWFFNAENLDLGETISLKFYHNGDMYSGRISNESSDRRRVRVFWNSDLGRKLNKHKDDSDPVAIFTRISDTEYEVSFEGGKEEVPISTKEVIEHTKNYISAKGFDYPDGLVENFFLSLKSKPFVILAGTSGTGKTRLVKLFAEAIGAEYKLVPVRPDWSDSTDLFGHVDLNERFIPGAILGFIRQAQDHPNKPYFLCLDEMNLARVEYYLSDFLSVIETRDMVSGKIMSDPLISAEQYGSDEAALETYGEIQFPQNLYVVGTVNMDETTFPFSKKVLDRANTIEFNYVDLMPKPKTHEAVEQQAIPNSFLRSEYLLLSQCDDEAEYVGEICSELQTINRILLKANAHIGYRIRDEIVFYLVNNKKEGDLLSHNDALDNEILQKVLPRIQGSTASVRDMLCDLFKVCAADHNQRTADTDSEKMRKVLDDSSVICKYRKSAEKLQMMVQRFEEDGFTSYWL